MGTIKQKREGLPVSLTEERRFFEMRGTGKTDTPQGWNDPNNWKELDEIPEDKPFGFVVGTDSDYALIEGDHVFDEAGGWVDPFFKDAFSRIWAAGITYYEKSISGRGFHLVCDLGDFADAFEPVNNSYDEIIINMSPEEYKRLTKEERDKTPKIEIFYHVNGRYLYLTGNNKEVHEVAKDETAAAIFRECLAIREECRQRYGTTTRKKETRSRAAGAVQAEVLEALPYISAAEYEIWVHVGIALEHCGFDYSVWDEWSQWSDKRAGLKYDGYNPEETASKWKSFETSKSQWNTGTIFRLAKENGWRQSLEPADYTDLGQANVLVREYGHLLKYSKATRFIVYNGKKWDEDDLKAQRLSQELTERQLKEARERISKARAVLDDAIESQDKNAIKSAKDALKPEEKFREYILKRRATDKIRAALTEAAPCVQIAVTDLDADGYLLNTPEGTIDLRSGEIHRHTATDYCTKITTVSASDAGRELWTDFLERLTVGDQDLQRYLQEVAGLCAIGCVKREELIIAVGTGGNGKSTFFNTLFRVLGDYAGVISSDVLTDNARGNKKNEYAEIRGKRLIVAAELEERSKLDTAAVKKLCSTDPIQAEKKYKDLFYFIPSHHVVLYTNHLPEVSTSDAGTWDRLIVIPFNARFRGQSDEVKDYTSLLVDQCGGAVMSWIVEGARRVIEQHFIITLPEAVKEARNQYKADNDWLAPFIEAYCVEDPRARETGGKLYEAYRQYCDDTGEDKHSNGDFSKRLRAAGFKSTQIKGRVVYRGLKILSYAERLNGEIEARG